MTSSDEDKLDTGSSSSVPASTSEVLIEPSTSTTSSSSQYRMVSNPFHGHTGLTQSASNTNTIEPSQTQGQAQQQAQQHRVRPTPIVWDQPTSSSSTSAPQQQQLPLQQQVVQRSSASSLHRGMGRGGRGRGGMSLSRVPGSSPGTPPLMQLSPEPGMIRGQALHGFRPMPRGAQQQSARRSRPHGPRPTMRGSGPGPRPRGPY